MSLKREKRKLKKRVAALEEKTQPTHFVPVDINGERVGGKSKRLNENN